MPSTTRGAFPYPIGTTAPPNVHLDIKALADQAAAVGALFLQGTLAARPAAATANQGYVYWTSDTGQLYYSTGAAWKKIDFRIPAATSFPTSPVDDDEASIDIADGSATRVRWRFAYWSGAADAYKWMFVGGPDLSEKGSASTFSANGSAYSTGAPFLTTPRPGYYDIEFGADISVPTGGTAQLDLVVAGSVLSGSIITKNTDTGTQKISLRGRIIAWELGTGNAVTLQVSSTGGGTASLHAWWVALKPARVAP